MSGKMHPKFKAGDVYVSRKPPFAETANGRIKVFKRFTAPPSYDVVVKGVLRQPGLDADEAIRYLTQALNQVA